MLCETLSRVRHISGGRIHSKAFKKLAGKVSCELTDDLSDDFKGYFNMNPSF